MNMKKNIIKSLIIINFIAFSATVYAEAPVPQIPGVQTLFLLNQAINIAVERNPVLQAELSRTGISKAEITGLKTVANPYFTFNSSIPEGIYSFGLQKIIQLGNTGKYRKNIASIRREIDLLEVQRKILDVRQETRDAYIQYFASRKKLSVYSEIYDKLKNYVEHTRKNPPKNKFLDLLMAENELISLANNIEVTKYEIIKAQNHLEEIVGVDFDKEPALQEPTELPDLLKNLTGENLSECSKQKIAKLTQIALNCRPAAIEANKNIELSRNQYKLAQLGRIPLVILEAGAEIDNNNDEPEQENEVNAFINGNIELPIFDRHQGPVDQALAETEFNIEQKKSIDDNIAHEVKNAYTALAANKERILRYQNSLLPKAEELNKEAIKNYKNANLTASEFLRAERVYIDTQLAYLDALVDFQTAISELERAIGVQL
jgi:outer membrane protein TolC